MAAGKKKSPSSKKATSKVALVKKTAVKKKSPTVKKQTPSNSTINVVQAVTGFLGQLEKSIQQHQKNRSETKRGS